MRHGTHMNALSHWEDTLMYSNIYFPFTQALGVSLQPNVVIIEEAHILYVLLCDIHVLIYFDLISYLQIYMKVLAYMY